MEAVTLHLNVADLDEAARQIRALNKAQIEVPYLTVAGHVFVLESVIEAGQMGEERRYIVTEIKPCTGC